MKIASLEKRNSIYIISILILLGVLSRIIPHPANFTAIGALSLIAGALSATKNNSKSYWTFAFIPLLSMLISDFYLGFHSQQLNIYLATILCIPIGRGLAKADFTRFFGCSFASSLVFFVLSNFSVWLEGRLYSRDFMGLWSCFVAAIPFFGWTFTSTVFYLVLIRGVVVVLGSLTKAPTVSSLSR